jgi:hypothetical protein
VVLAVLAMLAATPAFAAGGFDVTGDVVVSHVDTDRFPAVALEVAPPRLLATGDLTAGAFTVTEDGAARPATVTRLPNAELQLALVIDPSVAPEVFRNVQGAVLDFLLRLPLGTRVAVVSAGARARVRLPATADLGAATAAVGDLGPSRGRLIRDALRRADEQLRRADRARRAIVVFSAGKDTTSSTSPDALERLLRSSGTRLYAVELTSGDGDDALKSLAGEIGGQSTKVSATDLVGGYQRVADVLLNQYRVTFEATSPGRARLDIRVEAEGVTGASAVSVQLGKPGPDSPARDVAPATDAGGGRAVAEPLAAGLAIGILLLGGAVLVTLGRAGLRSRETAGRAT